MQHATATLLHAETCAPSSRVTGELRLRFDLVAGTERTILTAHSQPPLKVVRAFTLDDGAALVHLHNLSGGVLGGDHLEMTVTVAPHARAQLTSTGATRLYRSHEGVAPAIQLYNIYAGADALIEVLPDPLIPFAGAHYHQETSIELGPGAGLFWWETVVPGREARGEFFEYQQLEFKLDIVAEGRPLARERTRLEPQRHPLTAFARLGPYRSYSTFYICRVGLDAACWARLEAELTLLAQQLNCDGETIWGVSTLPAHGLSVRGLSRTSRHLVSGLTEFWRAAKWSLYGQKAVSPRKVY